MSTQMILALVVFNALLTLALVGSVLRSRAANSPDRDTTSRFQISQKTGLILAIIAAVFVVITLALVSLIGLT